MLCAALLLAGLVLGATAPATAAGMQAQENSTTNDSTATQAELVRVTPANPNEDYLSIQTKSSDAVFNTSGPHATFSLSEPVDAARIEQPKANVQVLGGGSVLRVEYADDAGVGGNASLYTAELFFGDGSTRTIDLYATQTDVSLAGAEYAAYSDYIDYTLDQAEANGYDRSPEGAQNYLEDQEEAAELFDSLFTEQILMFLAIVIQAARNFVTWVLAIGFIAGLAIYFERKHGWILRLQQMAESRAELMREAVRQDYEERRNTAAKHPLEDVTEIGPNAARYWRELGVETVDDMIEIACKGIVSLTDDGRIQYDDDDNVVYAHHGVEDLTDVDPLTMEQLRSQTWLGPLVLEGRLAPTTALSNIEAALLVAEKEYNRGNEVRDARRTVSELNDRLAGRRDFEDAETSSNAARTAPQTDFTGSAAGGD